MPRNVYFGDGTPIPDETMEYIGNLYEELCVDFPWESGDLVAVDNMLVQHARTAVHRRAKAPRRDGADVGSGCARGREQPVGGAMSVELTPPRVATPIPGPRSRVLLERQAERESNARTYPRRLPIAIARAAGSYVEDVDSNVFIDFLTGAGVLALGHNHPEVVEAVERQLARAVPRARLPDRDQGRVRIAPALAAPGGDAGRPEDPVLRAGRRKRRRRGPEALQDGDRTRRDRRVPRCVPRQHAQRNGGHRARLPEVTGAELHAGRPLLPVPVPVPVVAPAGRRRLGGRSLPALLRVGAERPERWCAACRPR